MTKPKVRAEPIPQPKAKAAPAAAKPPVDEEVAESRGTSSQLAPGGLISQIRPPLVDEVKEKGGLIQKIRPLERPPSPEPPSPRTLFRQTSAHLLNLRDVMNSHKRADAAERYTSRLHAWPVV